MDVRFFRALVAGRHRGSDSPGVDPGEGKEGPGQQEVVARRP